MHQMLEHHRHSPSVCDRKVPKSTIRPGENHRFSDFPSIFPPFSHDFPSIEAVHDSPRHRGGCPGAFGLKEVKILRHDRQDFHGWLVLWNHGILCFSEYPLVMTNIAMENDHL